MRTREQHARQRQHAPTESRARGRGRARAPPRVVRAAMGRPTRAIARDDRAPTTDTKSSSSSSRGRSRGRPPRSSLARTRDRGAARRRRRRRGGGVVLVAARGSARVLLLLRARAVRARGRSARRDRRLRATRPRRAAPLHVPARRDRHGQDLRRRQRHRVATQTNSDAGRRPEQDARRAGGARAPRVSPRQSSRRAVRVALFAVRPGVVLARAVRREAERGR